MKSVNNQIDYKLRNQIYNQTRDQVQNRIYWMTWCQAIFRVWDPMPDQVWRQIQMRNYEISE